MKKLYQTEWHSIPFRSFATMRSDRLAGPDFYQKFYAEFFKRFRSPSDLNQHWIDSKKTLIKRLLAELPIKKTERILSIGCGTGIMEMELIRQGFSNVEVTEISNEPLEWLRKTLPPDRIHVGIFPEAISDGKKYDWILLSAIDYFFDEKALPRFLAEVGKFLAKNGRGTLVCTPDNHQSVTPIDKLKHFVRDRFPQLQTIGLLKPAQLWGFTRSRQEYRDALTQAGLYLQTEGEINSNSQLPDYQLTFTTF